MNSGSNRYVFYFVVLGAEQYHSMCRIQIVQKINKKQTLNIILMGNNNGQY